MSGWSSARVVSEKTRETKEETGGDLVGHYYVVSRCPLIINSTARGRQGQRPAEAGQLTQRIAGHGHGIAWHSMTVICAAVG